MPARVAVAADRQGSGTRVRKPAVARAENHGAAHGSTLVVAASWWLATRRQFTIRAVIVGLHVSEAVVASAVAAIVSSAATSAVAVALLLLRRVERGRILISTSSMVWSRR